jgi:hypothetical protein
MKDSILHATVAHAIDFAYIQGAWRRMEVVRSAEADPAEPPTLSELEEAWGEAVGNAICSREIGGTRIYRIELADGSFALREMAGHWDAAMLRCQNKRLRVPDASDVPGLRVLNILRCCPQSDWCR